MHSADTGTCYWLRGTGTDWLVSQPFKTRTRALQAKMHGKLRWRRETEVRPGGKP